MYKGLPLKVMSVCASSVSYDEDERSQIFHGDDPEVNFNTLNKSKGLPFNVKYL